MSLPLPTFYDRANAGRYEYRPNQRRLFEESAAWRTMHRITGAGSDTSIIHLLLIDTQKDFCFPEGTLYVGGRSGTGAVEDNARTAEFIYHNLNQLTKITTTMDTHFAVQIFFASFWVDSSDAPLAPHTVITTEMVRSGKVKPSPMMAWFLCNGNYAWLEKQALFYCEELERQGKYTLYLWPEHTILGSDGHALVGVIHEARMFQSFVRGAQSWAEIKGGNALTENYSVFRPEVLMRHDGKALAQKNTGFVKTLVSSDMVIIGGQAASHCVKSSIDDLLDEILAADPALARKVYLLTDCMSSVVVPDGKGGFFVDFTPQADAALARFASAGMHLVKSTDDMSTWPKG